MTNYTILNNENPYIQDSSLIVNPKDYFDLDINNDIINSTSSISSNTLNLDTEFIINNEIENINKDNEWFELLLYHNNIYIYIY